MTAFFSRGKLILKVDSSSSCFYHSLHEFKSIQRASKPGFCIGNNRSKPVRSVFSFFQNLDLVRTKECIVNFFHHCGNTIGRI